MFWKSKNPDTNKNLCVFINSQWSSSQKIILDIDCFLRISIFESKMTSKKSNPKTIEIKNVALFRESWSRGKIIKNQVYENLKLSQLSIKSNND